MRRGFIIAGAALLGAILLIVVLVQQEFALRWAVGRLVAYSDGTLVLNGVSGRLTRTMHVEEMIYQTAERRVTAKDAEITWSVWQLFSGSLNINSLYVSDLSIETLAASGEAFTLPQSLAPPVAIQVDKLQIDRLHYGTLVFEDVQLELTANRQAWKVSQGRFNSPFGKIAANVELQSAQPFSLAGKASADHEKGSGSAEIGGQLDNMTFSAQFSGFDAEVDAKGRLQPFALFPLPELNLQAKGLDPSKIKSGWPVTDVTADAQIAADSEGRVSGTIKADNRLAGPLDANRLPVQAVSSRLSGSLENVLFQNILLDLGKGGQFTGQGRLTRQGVDLDLTTRQLNLAAVHSSTRPTAIRGTINLAAEEARQTLAAQLSQQNLMLELAAVQADKVVTLSKFNLRSGSGMLSVNGKLALADKRAFEAHGKVSHFNLASLGAYPSTDINMNLDAQGQLLPEWLMSLAYDIRPSRFRNQPLTGKGKGTITAASISQVDATLALGVNRLAAQGSFGRSGEKLVFDLDAPELAAIGPGYSGSLKVSGEASGSFSAMQLNATAAGSRLVLPGQIQATSFQATARFGNRRHAPIDIRLTGDAVTLAGQNWGEFLLTVNGTIDAHAVNASLKSSQSEMQLKLSGGWQPKPGWRGNIEAFSNTGEASFSLAAPAALQVAPNLLSLQNVVLLLPDGRLNINRLEKRLSRIQSDGSATGVPLRYITAFVPALRKKLGGSLVFGAEWNVDLDRTVSGSVHAFRESGDLVIRGENSIRLGLSEFDARANLARNALEARANVKSDAVGTVQLLANTELLRTRNGWHFPPQSPFQLQLDLDVPKLDWVSAVAAQPDIDIGGSLKGTIRGSGTIAQPRFTGSVVGNDLSFRWFSLGVKLQDGQLRASVEGNRFTLEQAVIRGDQGQFEIRGGGRLENGLMLADMNFAADNLLLLSSPDRQLSITGTGEFHSSAEKIDLTGQWTVNRALIQSLDYHNVAFSDDVVVLGREETQKQAGTAALPINMDMRVNLGNNFRIDGWGLDALLQGDLQATSNASQGLRLAGTIQAVNGTFNAYGQKLTLQRGNVVFNGPAARPTLDILAVREVSGLFSEGAVEAGVQVRGTPQNLQVRLVSDPEVPDSEKLSWLILGHGGAQNAGDHDRSVMTAAANALLSTTSLGAVQSGIASTIGLDDISVGSSADAETTVLSVSKKITDRLYLTYEQGLSAVSNLVKLRFLVSQRVRLEAAAGTTSAIDLLYEWSFD